MTTPVPPEVRAKIEAWLSTADQSKTGKVFRGEWHSPEDRRRDYENTLLIKQLLGDEPATPLYARRLIAKLCKIRNWAGATPELVAYIDRQTPMLRPMAQTYRPGQIAKAMSDTKRYEKFNIPGVYVYSMPVLLDHPMNDEGFVYLKVGHSKRIWDRIVSQLHATTNPEELVLLRIYRSDEMTPLELEGNFHQRLDAAGLQRGTGGLEWFITSLEFLDAIGDELGTQRVSTEVEADLEVQS